MESRGYSVHSKGKNGSLEAGTRGDRQTRDQVMESRGYSVHSKGKNGSLEAGTRRDKHEIK